MKDFALILGGFNHHRSHHESEGAPVLDRPPTIRPVLPLEPQNVPRCEVCDWPLAASVAEGCVEGNCSYRPRVGTDEYRRIQTRQRELEGKDRR